VNVQCGGLWPSWWVMANLLASRCCHGMGQTDNRTDKVKHNDPLQAMLHSLRGIKYYKIRDTCSFMGVTANIGVLSLTLNLIVTLTITQNDSLTIAPLKVNTSLKSVPPHQIFADKLCRLVLLVVPTCHLAIFGNQSR